MLLLPYLKSKIFIRTIITMVVSVIIGVFLLKLYLNYSTHHTQKIEVPNLAKLSLEDTQEKLKALDLELTIMDSVSFNPNYPPKSVIDQNPEAGDFVKENRKIYVTLNPSSYRKITIPNVLNKTKRQVETHLKSVGFRIGKYTYIPDIGRDVVRRMKHHGKVVKPGSLLPKNSKIDLVLGDGKAGGNQQ